MFLSVKIISAGWSHDCSLSHLIQNCIFPLNFLLAFKKFWSGKRKLSYIHIYIQIWDYHFLLVVLKFLSNFQLHWCIQTLYQYGILIKPEKYSAFTWNTFLREEHFRFWLGIPGMESSYLHIWVLRFSRDSYF